MDNAQWDGTDSNASASVLGEYTYLQVDSAAASQYGGYDHDAYLASPRSETIHDLDSMSMMAMGLHQSPGVDTPPSSEEGQDDSDGILDSLLRDVEPRSDRFYYCKDVDAEDHSCGFVHERRCMLRCVGIFAPTVLHSSSSNHVFHSKHLEQTLKTNVCHQPVCKGQAFSSKAVLTRHEREAHGMHQATQYFCPDPGCERASRGFAREYNMADHIARVHKELDANQYLKKTKRSKKGGQSSSVVSGGSTVVEGGRRRSAAKPRRQREQQQQQQHFEREFRESQENASSLWSHIHDPRNPDSLKYIHQLQSELTRLEDAYVNLHSTGND
jgi:hypothetical protein